MLNRVIHRGVSIWKNVPQGPPDVLIGLSEAFFEDTSDKKIRLCAGVYRDDSSNPWVLPSVQAAKKLISNTDHEYAPIEGYEDFRQAASKLAYGDSVPYSVLSVMQCLSGTGAVRLAMAYLSRFHTQSRLVLIPRPSWPAHEMIATHSGLDSSEYAYYDPATNGLNFSGMIEDLENASPGTIVVLHACAHNPTGIDLTPKQWDELLEVFKRKRHVPFFDSAYQGFATGDIDRDHYAVRTFAKSGIQVILAQSFSKNFGLYGERIGQLSIVCENNEEAGRVSSQLKMLARAMYSNPPIYGAKIVSTILNTPELYQQWLKEIIVMADRITGMRSELVKQLQVVGSKHDWGHLTEQIGMFAFTGLNSTQCKELTDKHHIYLSLDGRISLTGVNTGNVNTVAKAIYSVAG